MSNQQVFPGASPAPPTPQIEFVQGNDAVNVGPDAVTGVIQIIGNETQGISVLNTAANQETISASDASTSQKGVILLASPGEALAGTNTTKTMTPSDVQAKVGVQTLHGLAYGGGNNAAINWLAEAANGQIPIGSTGNNPILANITSSDGSVTVTNGPGSINLSVVGATGVVNSVTAGTGVNVTPTTGNVVVSVLANSKITKITSNGTWTVDSRTVLADLYAWSGGAGGGSGRCGASASSGGGGGGSGGTFVHQRVLASSLTGSPYTVTIGNGGAGGASVNAVLSNGNPGVSGGTTSVGNLIVATGGSPGQPGATSPTTSQTTTSYNLFNATSGISGGGVGSTAVAGGNGSSSTNPYKPSSGGGGGAGFVTVTGLAGGNGGGIDDLAGNVLVAGGAGGSTAGTNGSTGNAPVAQDLTIGGTGGGGGGCDGVSVSGSGGNGAVPGGGGGGGAGALSSTPSGAGGNGGAGMVIIVEYF